MGKGFKTWTDEEFAVLQQLIKVEAPTASHLAAALNRLFPMRNKPFTRNSVIGKCIRAGLQLPNMPKQAGSGKQPKGRVGKWATTGPRAVVSLHATPQQRAKGLPAMPVVEDS